jgi:hypothetical protein
LELVSIKVRKKRRGEEGRGGEGEGKERRGEGLRS